jgi:hypothetical protein
MTNFVEINSVRLSKNTIKRYQPVNDKELAIYFNATRTKIDKEIFKFSSNEARNNMLHLLDALL